ncbi:hypothetical protein [Streptomyces sp. CAU 1734]|uniref:hypothetical protein n=1 Tax=Streptomyces sp. CAU 1734 TaxID=3140360 RepID=UPI003261519D
MTDWKASAGPVDHQAELAALIQAEGVFALAPDWVPRTGYARPTADLLRLVADGLRRADG